MVTGQYMNLLFVPTDRSPDTSRIRSKMLYASSKDRFRRELDGIQIELQATDPSEMSLDVISGRAAWIWLNVCLRCSAFLLYCILCLGGLYWEDLRWIAWNLCVCFGFMLCGCFLDCNAISWYPTFTVFGCFLYVDMLFVINFFREIWRLFLIFDFSFVN